MAVMIPRIAGMNTGYCPGQREVSLFEKISDGKLYSAFFASGVGCIAVLFNLLFKMAFTLTLQLRLFLVLAQISRDKIFIKLVLHAC